MSNTSFFTLVDSTGAEYRAQEIGSRINTSDLSGKSSIPGLSKFQLLDGRTLNKKSESTFELVATGEELYVASSPNHSFEADGSAAAQLKR